ncbi:MAG: transposase, partial [Deltaproteobacteria bacterium]
MPRQPRLDAPGLLQHVMARGIQRCRIFRDHEDYADFLARLGTVLTATQTRCYAWALLPDHFHLLLRSQEARLSRVMRSLMTGYAVMFNRRHRRNGHLFQNRYKSIICEEEPYFLELIRYIHLNPLRAGIVESLSQLGGYPWTGHSALTGGQSNGWQETGEVLGRFSEKRSQARLRYRSFIAAGLDQREIPDLEGGGRMRSSTGKGNSLADKGGDPEIPEIPGIPGIPGVPGIHDERVLGKGGFVEKVLKETGLEGTVRRPPMPLSELVGTVSEWFKVDAE